MSDKQKEFDQILGKVRARAISLLKDEKAASDISFALTYVATELGLSTADQPVQVFPLILRAMTQASDDFSRASQTDKTGLDPFEALDSSSPIH